VLHIDGDEELLNKCLKLYKELGVSCEGICIKEEEIHLYIENLIKELTPDIIVLTGHDQYNGTNIKDLSSYKNTSNFIKAIRIIRKCYLAVVISAGACGSNFEALIGNGANIASSPKRINTHTYDPAVAAIKVATTPYDTRVDFRYIYKYIENGKDALGGIETNGKMRLLL
jgi:spore coat assembly protein